MYNTVPLWYSIMSNKTLHHTRLGYVGVIQISNNINKHQFGLKIIQEIPKNWLDIIPKKSKTTPLPPQKNVACWFEWACLAVLCFGMVPNWLLVGMCPSTDSANLAKKGRAIVFFIKICLLTPISSLLLEPGWMQASYLGVTTHAWGGLTKDRQEEKLVGSEKLSIMHFCDF